MPKLIYVHEGNYRKGKRNKLKNVHYIGCLGKNSEELIKKKKIETKLKKYDKIIARNIKTGVEETKTYTFEIEKTGMHSNIRKILNKIIYG